MQKDRRPESGLLSGRFFLIAGIDKDKGTGYNSLMGQNSLLENRTFQFVCKYFLLASAVAFFGWFFETMSFVILWEPNDRGMLTLPFCYLYGAVALAVWFTLGTPFSGNMGKLYARMKGKSASRLRTVVCAAAALVLYFAAVTLLSTLVELVIGLIFIKGLGMPLWSYRNFEHTFLDIICLDFSLLWGALITVGMCTLWRLFMFAEQKLSPRVRAVAAIVLASLVLCDFIFNCTYFFVTGTHFDLF